jgi:beta-RFAP synthase
MVRPSGPGYGPFDRAFGSVGLMIREPGILLTLRGAEKWSATGAHADRVLGYAQRLAQVLPQAASPVAIAVERAPTQHLGLGTGTQLAMAVIRGRAALRGLSVDISATAEGLGRGQRSAIGVHGSCHGGFLIDGGRRDRLAPLVARLPVPEEWPIVLIIPRSISGLHGQAERDAFDRLAQLPSAPGHAAELSRLVLLGMLPALAEKDCRAFGEALHDFNRRVGETFALVQGSAYAHPRLGEIVNDVRGQGVPGVGQSSWGPALFAIASDEDVARSLLNRLRSRFDLSDEELCVTRADNKGIELTIVTES